MKDYRIGSGLIMLFLVLIIAGIACTNYTIPEKEKPEPPPPPVNYCEVCHTDYETLVAVHTPDTAVKVGWCVVDTVHYEPYERVFMGGDGFDAFKASSHYPVGCSGCHNGDSETAVKDSAHAGFIKHPSLFYEDKCAACHNDITDNFASSLHNGTGQKRKVAMRSGLNGADEFDQLPAHQIEGYNNNCAQCHGTCGNCHVVRPSVGGGGLSAGHNFNKTPDNSEVCMTCHACQVKPAFLGEAPGTEPDVHSSNMGYGCLDCHDGHELHGNGEKVEQRYAYKELPTCEQCHTDIKDANYFHTMHMGDFNCQVCHSQDYNNCGSCHINGDRTEIQSYLDFKIAANPLPDLKGEYDFAPVRRTPAKPDNWKEYGVEEYANFDVLPTYSYTTPHNILKWTERTRVENGSCWNNCHIRREGGVLLNTELYLFQSDLEVWEIDATSDITVDGKLPDWWPSK